MLHGGSQTSTHVNMLPVFLFAKIMIFSRWLNSEKTQAEFLEEPGSAHFWPHKQTKHKPHSAWATSMRDCLTVRSLCSSLCCALCLCSCPPCPVAPRPLPGLV